VTPEDRFGLPGWADRLLARVLPSGIVGASIRGDLAQEYTQMKSGPKRALWLVWEVAKLTTHYGARGPAGGGGGMGASLKFALRRMRRDPGFTALSVLTIALGVGSTVGLFSLVETVLLEPLPYDEPAALVALFEAVPNRGITRNVANPGNVVSWAEATGLSGVGAIVLPQPRILSGAGETREVMSSIVTPDFLPVLGLDVAFGRRFASDAEGALSGEAEIVLTHRGWQELFGGDADVLGRLVEINGGGATVIGVLPPVHVPFADGSMALLTLPMARMGDQTNTGRFLNVVGRLAPDTDVGRVRGELAGIQAGLRESYPDFNAGWEVEVEPLRDVLLGDVRAPLWILLSAVALLLIVACVNVANLTLARATDRQAEMAVRASLGASGGALARQLLVESLVLAAVGGLIGIGLAALSTRLLTAPLLEAFTIPRLGEVSLDGTVVLFSMAIIAATGIFFGLTPALTTARRRPGATLGAEGRGTSRGTGRIRSALVLAEVALSVVLLTSAGLLVRSWVSLGQVDAGFEPSQLVTGRVNLTGPRYQEAGSDQLFFEALVPQMASMPGVEAAGGVAFLPLDGLGSATSYYPADRAVPPRDEWRVADVRPIVGDYFGAMGIALVRGRSFNAQDQADGPRAVVISQSLADRAWPGEDAIGKPLAINWADLESWTVVGVVEDVLHTGLDDSPREMVYHTYRQAPYFRFMTLAVRTRSPTSEALAGLKDAVAAVDPGVPVTRTQTMDELVRGATARPRMTAFLITLFAGAAVLLTAVGLYGVVSYAVARRVREIGVRMALGARREHVLRLVSWQGMRLVLAGGALGLVGAALVTRFLSTVLFQTSNLDPAAFVGASAFFALVGLTACVIPTLRALRIEPGQALRDR
jgi:putative ABC transport system permease protein